MNWVLMEMKQSSLLSPEEQPFNLSEPAPFPESPRSGGFDLNSKISPSILLVIIILSIIFFISGLLHLLVRFLLTPTTRDHEAFDDATAVQGQLQQLFNLHDSGVDQSFIDTLPVFPYKTIIGLKNPFDCAVCLCEFDSEDKLRLLPQCSHAFHTECIDTWLLSHSTCPLCRASLLSDLTQSNTFSPFVFVLESGSESSREMVTTERDNHMSSGALRRNGAVLGTNAHPAFHQDYEFGSNHFDLWQKAAGNHFKVNNPDLGGEVVPVKLGKFRNVDGGGECSSNSGSISQNNVESRRCLSMDSFEYVMDEDSTLRVHVSLKKYAAKKQNLVPPRGAISECDSESRRDFTIDVLGSMNFGEERDGICNCDNDGMHSRENKRESFSISKIWLRGKREKQKTEDGSSSRRAFSFRFPVQRIFNEEDSKSRKVSNCDVESQSYENSDSLQTKTPSFARRTLLWLVGKQNKSVNSSITPVT